jgi:hypothetical protein
MQRAAALALRSGEKISKKLTRADVDEMRRRHAAGEANFAELGSRFGISVCQANRIINRRSWKE